MQAESGCLENEHMETGVLLTEAQSVSQVGCTSPEGADN